MSLLLIILAVLFLGRVSLAAPDIGIKDLTSKVAEGGGYETGGVTDTSLSQSIGQVIKVVLGFVGVIFLVLTVYAGILWMTASGNEERVTTATNILKAAVVGLVIVVAAYSITYFVTKKVSRGHDRAGAKHSGRGGHDRLGQMVISK